jgi:hypothetical protein
MRLPGGWSVRSIQPSSRRAFGVVGEALVAELEWVDAGLADRLAAPLRELVRSTLE